MIGKALGRAASTVSRDLRRNLHSTGQYRPFHAQLMAAQRRRRPKQPRLGRQYFPKSTDLSLHTPTDRARVEHEFNRRPRMVLGDRPPAELFDALPTSQNHPQLR